MFTILHISDLHRSREEPVDNNSLLAALLADSDRYIGENPHIPYPDSIVVSGDLIQGAPVGLSNWQQSMKDQYGVANDFLSALCERFLGGDRSGLVLVPGNHDVCWNTSFASMERVPKEQYPRDLYSALVEPDSNYRWSWKEQALYRIADMARYGQRMEFYWNFIESFYAGVNLPIPIDRHRGFQLLELGSRRIVVAAFDSITSNDCFGHSGAIPRGAVGRCALALRDTNHFYDLRMAVWHHSTQGPPIRADYMDVVQVQEMIGHGFQLGLHGHQHIAATQTQLVHLDESRSMAVVSAGSLCAGARELPRGINRQYNLIVIEDDFLRGRVHVREMGEGEQFSRKRNGAFLEGFVNVSWQRSIDVMGRAFDAQAENTRRAVMDAEAAVQNGRPSDAVRILETLDHLTLGSYARRLMVRALLSMQDWGRLAELLRSPETIEEAVTAVTALVECHRLAEAQEILDSNASIDAATRSGLQGRIDAKRLMRSS